jgi:hypothetical protein
MALSNPSLKAGVTTCNTLKDFSPNAFLGTNDISKKTPRSNLWGVFIEILLTEIYSELSGSYSFEGFV